MCLLCIFYTATRDVYRVTYGILDFVLQWSSPLILHIFLPKLYEEIYGVWNLRVRPPVLLRWNAALSSYCHKLTTYCTYIYCINISRIGDISKATYTMILLTFKLTTSSPDLIKWVKISINCLEQHHETLTATTGREGEEKMGLQALKSEQQNISECTTMMFWNKKPWLLLHTARLRIRICLFVHTLGIVSQTVN